MTTAEAQVEVKPEPRFYRSQFAVFGQWWCVAEDLTAQEQEEMVLFLRSETFAKECPMEFIRDRLYGGFPCGNDPSRRHVYFALGSYSHTAASEGDFYPNDLRDEDWQTLCEKNSEHPWVGGGPFCEGSEVTWQTA